MSESSQTMLPLSEQDAKMLAEQRGLIEKYIADEKSRENYKTPAGKLGTIRALLKAKAFKPTQKYELQCLGVVLGDAFVQDMGFHWIIVKDEYGRDPAIQYERTSIILYPLTMISKRIERGDDVDVFDLYNGIAEQVEKLIRKGQ